MEIIGRLPVKSVARFLLVSKSWERIISSREFIRSFPAGSCSSQHRLLVCFVCPTSRPWKLLKSWYFFSSSSSSTSFLSRVKCPLHDPEYFLYRFHCANGLIRLGYGKTKLIYNPSTGKSITLPIVTRVGSRCFFGFDPVNDQYKILCTTRNQPNGQESPLYEYQVLTLVGAEQSSWRKIECSIPYRFCSSAHVCIDGFVYYVARTGADLSQRSLMKFDLKHEKFNLVTSLSADMPRLPRGCSLINYEGKVAIPLNSKGNTFNVWVIDQAAREPGWLKKSFSIESWKSSSKLRIYGSTHTGEFVLAPMYYSDDFNVILYNPNTNGLRKIKVDVKGNYAFKFGRNRTRAMVFPEYVESIRLL
ncbi:hypothetical protein Bca4012_024132 [Brassica carinata]